ncbi:hypothetical protein WH221_00605 [Chryseobacterium culicis]|uniref:Uncharacterized protein n=1 Tax=Chryseobacterium culicis TaxID=680127 RepID=A0A2S9CWA6_CHRCI|nr:hypothetical protein [Chryseobacterium culicis]PRB84813.1 hypothetical protein CQ022_00565 [Chryseobacterium culicis]PRB87788.1 hypothetical protein CQ033_20310 [Chryseobacterium culicis]
MLKKLLIYLNIIDEIQIPVPIQRRERTPMEKALALSRAEMLQERQSILQEQKREASESLVKEKKVTEPIITPRERKTNRSYHHKIKNLAEYTKDYREYCLEKTSNQHMLKTREYHIYAKAGTTEAFQISEDAFISHNEHKMLRIESDYFVKYIQQEYNPITQMIENAYD